ncbi:MAG TPA: flagellar hook-length control protein FliK [Desulfuromonadaceae bacterium]
MVTLLSLENPQSSAGIAVHDDKSETTEKPAHTDAPMPQDVALLEAGMQIVLLPQSNGRMPESQNNGQNAQANVREPLQPAVRMEDKLVSPGAVDPGMIKGQEVTTGEAFAAAIKAAPAAVSSYRAGSATLSQQTETTAKQEVISAVEELKGSKDSLVGAKLLTTEGGPAQAETKSGIDSLHWAQKDTKTTDSLETASITEKQAGVKAADASVPVTISRNQTATGFTSTPAAGSPETPLVQPDPRAGTATVLSEQVTAPQAEIRVVHASAVTHPQAAVVMDSINKKTDSREDVSLKQQLDTATIKKDLEGGPLSLQKVAASFAAENEVLGEGNKKAGDQGLNEQFLSSNALQHSKTNEKQLDSTSVIVQKEPARSDLPENVVRQVKDMLVNREIKSGNEQMTLKLSPEHLGELTLNLKMENQQLRVQIVAENQGVKDALMQHSESLKESLSRQNIKMESFEVVTSGGQRGFEQNDKGWKQLAQQQFVARAPAYGSRYAIPEANTVVLPHYGKSQQYAMVDVHY